MGRSRNGNHERDAQDHRELFHVHAPSHSRDRPPGGGATHRNYTARGGAEVTGLRPRGHHLQWDSDEEDPVNDPRSWLCASAIGRPAVFILTELTERASR